jgi:hypothetical protein
MSDEIKYALRLAKQGKQRLHQSLARTGYKSGGKSENKKIKGEITTAPELEQRSRPAPYNRFNDLQQMLKNPPQVESPAHYPKDPKYYISPEEYEKGIYDDIYGTRYNALADGGSVNREGYALGGEPTNLTAGSNPAQSSVYDPFINSAYQTFMNRAPDPTGQQYWANQLQSGDTSQRDLLNSFANSAEFQNLYKTTPDRAVSGLYQSALGRTPDQGGLDYWQQQQQKGMSAQDMLNQFTNSPEFQNVYDINNAYMNYQGAMATPDQLASAHKALSSGKTMSDVEGLISSAPEATTNFINTAYKNMLGRAPDAAGQQYWSNALNSGAADKTAFLNSLASSAEGGNYANTQTLDQTFQRLMGRSPNQQEQNDYLSKMAAGTLTLDQLQKAVSQDPEAVNYENTNLVKDTFQALTGRQPTPEEQDDFASKMAAGTLDSDKLFAQISAMPESQKYQQAGNGAPTSSQDGKRITEIVSARPGVTTVKYSDGTIEQRSGDFGWRQNNPGNVKYSSNPNWWGHKFGAMEGGKAKDGGTFAVFPSLEAGNAARGHLLFESPNYKDLTLKQAMYRYAPPKSNPHINDYINGMAKAAGVSIDTRMRDFTPEQRQAAMKSQVESEGNRPGQVKILSLPSKPPVTAPPPTLTPEGIEEIIQSQGDTNVNGDVGGIGVGAPGAPSLMPVTGTDVIANPVPATQAPTYTPPPVTHSPVVHAPITHTPVTHTGGTSSHTSTHPSFSVGYQNDPYFGHAGVGGSGHIGGSSHTGGSDPYFGHGGINLYHQNDPRSGWFHGMPVGDGGIDFDKMKRGGRITRGLEAAHRATGGTAIKDALRIAAKRKK